MVVTGWLLLLVISSLLLVLYLILFSKYVDNTNDVRRYGDEQTQYIHTYSHSNNTYIDSRHDIRRLHMIHHDMTWSSNNTTSSSISYRSLATADDGATGSDNLEPSTTFMADTSPNANSRPLSLIKCNNQTRCIQPVLQLKKIYRVYYCNHVGKSYYCYL